MVVRIYCSDTKTIHNHCLMREDLRRDTIPMCSHVTPCSSCGREGGREGGREVVTPFVVVCTHATGKELRVHKVS